MSDVFGSAGGQLARVIASRGGRAAPEAALVIEHREALVYMLCEAAELEHAIMCEYLLDGLGRPFPPRPQMALCRCGASAAKPYCDGSHAQVGFTGNKDPKRVPDRRETFVGQQVTVLDNRGICQHSGLCSDRLATVFRTQQEPFVAPSGGRMDEIIRAVRDCPSGALGYAIDGVEGRDDVAYHGTREPAIEVSTDGPYRIIGAIPLSNERGEPEPRAEGATDEHYALCRCGQSQNKPFCSGMHWYVEFHDPVPDPEHEPTMFEWCGGLPALTRMTRLFYERYVRQDPLLAPLFATMSADHPERVAKWLAEVFGGPACYSEQYGGYPRMLSQHLGKCLTEELRTRWVELLQRSAPEAGLPNDPEFRSAFQSYIKLGVAARRRELPDGVATASAHADAALGLEHRRRSVGQSRLGARANRRGRRPGRATRPGRDGELREAHQGAVPPP